MHVIGQIHQGPNWNPGVPVTEQGTPMEEHLQYMKGLFDGGDLILGGPYASTRGGIAVFVTDSFEEAQRLADLDPAHQAGVIGYRLDTLATVFDAATAVDRSEALATVMSSPDPA